MVREQPTISVVVPVYNSATTIDMLVAEVRRTLGELAPAFEIILVNDGSQDESWSRIDELARRYPEVIGISLMRNYGQHNALLAGIRAASCSVIVTMDDDLQHPPHEIHRLLDKLNEGYDVVYGVPQRLPHTLWRNITSRMMKKFLSGVIGIKGAREMSAFRAFRTDLRRSFANFQSPTLYLDFLLTWGAARFASVQVQHDPRRFGRSNYTFRNLVRLAIMLLTGYSTAPLRLASLIGLSFTLFGMGVLVYVISRALIQNVVPGFPFLASIIALFSGAQLFALGIIGEYVAVIHKRLLEQPVYTVRETTEYAAQGVSVAPGEAIRVSNNANARDGESERRIGEL